MAFPFTIEFNEKLQIDNTTISEDEILLIIENYLEKSPATGIRKEKNQIEFKSFEYRRIPKQFHGIEKGEFSIEKIDGDYNLKYKFYYVLITILWTSFSVAISILSKNAVVGIVSFILFVIFFIFFSIAGQNTTYYEIISLINPKFKKPD